MLIILLKLTPLNWYGPFKIVQADHPANNVEIKASHGKINKILFRDSLKETQKPQCTSYYADITNRTPRKWKTYCSRLWQQF